MRELARSIALMSAALLAACATTEPRRADSLKSTPGGVAWFTGSVEEGFAAAKAQGKPIFLDWSAVWCPPCNQIKAVVLSSPEVAEVLRATIPITLDGDTQNAQTWADRLHVSSYPTLLILDPSGQELLRIGEFVEVPEFIAAVRSAIGQNHTLPMTVESALSGRATADDWTILAYASWEQLDNVDLRTRLRLFQAAPADQVATRALLAAKLLESAAGSPPAADVAAEVRGQGQVLLGAMLSSDGAVHAARSTIVESSREIVSWLLPDAGDPRRPEVIAQWTKAATWLATDPGTSLSTRLLSVEPAVELWLLQHPGQPVPAEIQARVHAAAAKADAAATSPFDRHAVISDAAELLADAGDGAAARELLEKELRTTDTPWYYQGSLARLAHKAGDDARALEWSAKARESARGQATRLQWTVSDLLLNAEVPGPDAGSRVAALLGTYFDLAFALPDGFSGRNGLRARRVASEAVKWGWPEVKGVFARYRTQCEGAAAPTTCRVAFPAG
jgi:thiol-disulfide isomerase/thioredoxin